MSEPALKVERQAMIRQLVQDQGRVTVPELSSRFGVSEATIRRDLEQLHSWGWVRRTHGGAVRFAHAAKEPPILHRISEQHEQKCRIGSAAAQMIRGGETIFLGSGTTVLEIVRALPDGLNLTIITNSLAIVNELAGRPQIELIVIGGMFRPSELSMVGHIAEQAIHELRADRVFMGIRAIDAAYGLANDFLPETMTDRAILGIAPGRRGRRSHQVRPGELQSGRPADGRQYHHHGRPGAATGRRRAQSARLGGTDRLTPDLRLKPAGFPGSARGCVCVR